jgi:hypothetical protein
MDLIETNLKGRCAGVQQKCGALAQWQPSDFGG